MFTLETVLDRLEKFDIDETTIDKWEQELGLSIPTDAQGQRQYSPHHINLFKNIRKHLVLGRTLEEIRNLIQLPSDHASRPKPITRVGTTRTVKPYATTPTPPAVNKTIPGGTNMVEVIESLNQEKDRLHQKLIETEKLNSHLYNANNMFHKKVKDLTETVVTLRKELKKNENFKLLDDKAQLQKQIIASEKIRQMLQRNVYQLNMELESAREEYKDMEMILDNRIHDLRNQLDEAAKRLVESTARFNATRFCGDWNEEANLLEVEYDNFGINIESNRQRVFRVSEVPDRTFGNTAVISTQYEYETNALWKRIETLVVTCLPNDQLVGQLIVEYIIDGVPVAKAVYGVVCKRA